MKTYLLLFILSLSTPLLAESIHVTFREYVLKGQGEGEPIWEQQGKDQVWIAEAAAPSEKYDLPVFPEITGTSKMIEEVTFTATKTGRGRIVIDLNEGETHLAHAQDNLLGDSCALSYTYSTGGGVVKIEILVWTHP